jgi:hypothetical protein
MGTAQFPQGPGKSHGKSSRGGEALALFENAKVYCLWNVRTHVIKVVVNSSQNYHPTDWLTYVIHGFKRKEVV